MSKHNKFFLCLATVVGMWLYAHAGLLACHVPILDLAVKAAAGVQ